MANLEVLKADLEKRYCPPLDISLFLVIISDYDLNDPSKVLEACDILDSLSAFATTEEASGFDASGSSGFMRSVEQGETELISEEDGQSEGTGCYSSPDDVSLSTGVSSIDLDEDSAACKEHDAQLESLDPQEKEEVIRSIFPGVKPLDIELTLRKCKNNAGKAIEELLNIVLLEETGSRLRGIDGFGGPDDAIRRKKKGKRKKKAGTDLDSGDTSTSSSSASPAPVSKWESASRDIEFISSNTKHPIQQVTSLYHKNGASTSNTIRAVLEVQKSLNLEYDDPNVEIYAADLAMEFPSIPGDQIRAIAELTFPTAAPARELARALTARPDPKQKAGGVKIEWRLPPADISSSKSPTSSSHPHPSSLYPEHQSPSSSSSSRSDGMFHSPKTSTEARLLRDKNFLQASAAYRKGNASNYQGAVAAYYASQARDYDSSFKSKVSEEADRLVQAQSWDGGLDLHGVGVKDAIRIAREGVTAWWSRRRGINQGNGEYRIVTGIGRHSVQHVAKLGPAVGRMLIREGWRVEVGTGMLVVTGVARVGAK